MRRFILMFLRVPFRRKIWLAIVFFLLVLIQTSLNVFSFAKIYRWVKRQSSSKALQFGSKAEEEIPWAVTRAGYFLYGDEGCLVQAIVGEYLLTQHGIPAKLRLGIRRQPDGAPFAHAWVESNGAILIGGTSSQIPQDFQSFPEFTPGID